MIDGTKLQESWFPTKQKFSVFLSHSHADEKLAVSIAGFLKGAQLKYFYRFLSLEIF